MSGSHEKRNLIIAGLIIGAIAGFLVLAGNPGNMGFCIACFVRDTVGGLGLHRAAPVQYIRPEIIGLILGAYVLSMIRGEHQSKGGSSPIIRFILGFFVMIGALMFLGCPIRMILRLGGGDLNALFGIAGFAGGIGFGTIFLKKGYSLQRTYALSKLESAMMPAIQVGLLVLVVAAPAFIFFSQKGPGAMHAPWLISLAAGLVVGGLSQFSRLCTVGGFRDWLCHNKQLINSHFYRGVSELPYKLLFAVIYTHLEFRYEVSHTITSHHVHHFHQTRIPDGTLLDYMVQYRKPLFPQFFLYPKKFLPENNPHHKEFHLRPYIQNNANQ